jgi:hypothetical protein
MGRLAQLAVHVDVVGSSAGVDPRLPDLPVALDRSDVHVEDAE